jgi:hypothetical protein
MGGHTAYYPNTVIFKVFPAVSRLVRIGSVSASGPFPGVTDHVGTAIRAIPLR